MVAPSTPQQRLRRPWGRAWPPLVIADRGATTYAPENSLRAFADAITEGADAITLDVRRCGSGEVVVFHEHTLAKFGGRRWDDVANTPLATLREIDLGRGEKIPLLSEAVDVVPPGILLDLRLRTPTGQSAEDHLELAMIVMAIVGRARASDRVLISADDGAVLAPFAASGVPTALLVPTMPIRVLRRPPREPSVVQLELHGADGATVRRWHARGAAVHLWPVNTTSQLVLAWSLRVDGVITNDPAGARKTIDRMARLHVG
jgi:glycerophosphoryl diester phosphodiesterase